MLGRWSVPGYTDVRELGRGASGRVVLAEHVETGKAVAVKYLADELCRDAGFLADFRAEAEVLASLDAPEVVRLWEYVQSPAGAAIVMDLVDGVSLRRMLDDRGPTEPEAALWVLQGSLRGLGAAHRRGVVHRDYKPENVLVTADGRSVLTDFGIAAAAGRDVAVAGTPSYMAPEQWAGAPVSRQTDIYAATASFVECLTGAPPYPGPDPTLLRRQHENAPIPTGNVPAPVRDLVVRGLAKHPGNRPADAETFLAELAAVAVTGYGEDWEERGRRRLAERAALLALLFPLAAGAAGASAVATTTLGAAALGALAGNRARALLGIAAAVVLIGGGAVAAATTFGGPSVTTTLAAAGQGAPPAAGAGTLGAGVPGSSGIAPSGGGAVTLLPLSGAPAGRLGSGAGGGTAPLAAVMPVYAAYTDPLDEVPTLGTGLPAGPAGNTGAGGARALPVVAAGPAAPAPAAPTGPAPAGGGATGAGAGGGAALPTAPATGAGTTTPPAGTGTTGTGTTPPAGTGTTPPAGTGTTPPAGTGTGSTTPPAGTGTTGTGTTGTGTTPPAGAIPPPTSPPSGTGTAPQPGSGSSGSGSSGSGSTGSGSSGGTSTGGTIGGAGSAPPSGSSGGGSTGSSGSGGNISNEPVYGACPGCNSGSGPIVK